MPVTRKLMLLGIRPHSMRTSQFAGLGLGKFGAWSATCFGIEPSVDGLLDKIREFAPDVVVLDLGLSYEELARIRRDVPEVVQIYQVRYREEVEGGHPTLKFHDFVELTWEILNAYGHEDVDQSILLGRGDRYVYERD